MQETWVQSLGHKDSPREGNGNPLQYSCLGNPLDRGTQWAAVHGVAKSWIRLSTSMASMEGICKSYLGNGNVKGTLPFSMNVNV